MNPNPNTRFIQSYLIAALLWGSAFLFNASAATLYWDADGSATTTLGGNGTWDTSSLNWNTSSAGTGTVQAWVNSAGTANTGDQAQFLGTSGNVTLGTNITAAKIGSVGGGLTYEINNSGSNMYRLLLTNDAGLSTGSLVLVQTGSNANITFNVGVDLVGGISGQGAEIVASGGSGASTITFNNGINLLGETSKILIMESQGGGAASIIDINSDITKSSASSSVGITLMVGGQTSGTSSGSNQASYYLRGNNTGLTGTTTFYRGNLYLENSGALGATAVSVGKTTDTTETAKMYTNVSGVTIGNNITFTDVATTSTGAARVIGGTHTSSTSTFGGTMTLGAQATSGVGSYLEITSASGGTTVFSGLITDGANTSNITKTGAGTVKFTNATGNTYDGATTVSAGTLLISNTSGSATGTGSVSVASGATLGGTGWIAPSGFNGLSVASGGTVAPGDGGIGTLTLDLSSTTGSDVFSSGALFTFDLAAPGSSDVMAFTGLTLSSSDVQFNGNTINFNDLGGLGTGTYTLFTFDQVSAYTGTLVLGTGLGSFSGDASLVYNASSIDLVIVAVPEPTTYVLVGMGLSTLWILRRRRRN